jgi:hypothetical protein
MRPSKRKIRIDGHTIIIVENGRNLIRVIRPAIADVPDELYQNVLSGIG